MKGENIATDTLKGADGWAALELASLDEIDQAVRQQKLLIAGHFQSTFCNSEQGKFVLDTLVRDYLLPRIANPGDDAVTIGIRQGQADVVRQILALIELARTGGAPT